MGCKPEGKEETLAETQAKANEATAAQMGALAQAQKAAQKANETDQSQDTAKSDKDQSANKAEDNQYKSTVKENEEDKDGLATEQSAESKDSSNGSTFDVEQLGVPFSRGYNPVDIKL